MPRGNHSVEQPIYFIYQQYFYEGTDQCILRMATQDFVVDLHRNFLRRNTNAKTGWHSSNRQALFWPTMCCISLQNVASSHCTTQLRLLTL